MCRVKRCSDERTAGCAGMDRKRRLSSLYLGSTVLCEKGATFIFGVDSVPAGKAG